MSEYTVYATRYDSTGIVDELVPARNLSFSMPLSDHGEATFEATVEPKKSFWRPSISLPVSGILIARDGVPVWSGWITDERMTGPRTYSFTCKEWGAFFEDEVPAVPQTWTNVNDHEIFRDLISAAQAIRGQNLQIQLDESTTGAHASDRTVNAWDDTTVGREFRSVADAEGGPEWYFGIAGTLDSPIRQLVLGDRLGQTEAQAVLEYVEDTLDYELPDGPPAVALLGSLFPGEPLLVPPRRAGGNLIAMARTRSVANASTVARATGSGEEAARLESTAEATTLLDAGYPRMTSTTAYSDVVVNDTLDDHAAADLAKRAGVATGYSLVSLDGDPTADWTQTPRGSTLRLVLDTDVFGSERPLGDADGIDVRCTNVTVRVPDSGDAQVEWSVLETFLDGDVTISRKAGDPVTVIPANRTWTRGRPWRTYNGSARA